MNPFEPELNNAIHTLLQELGLPETLLTDVRAHKFGITWGEVQRNLRTLANDSYFIMQAAQCGS